MTSAETISVKELNEQIKVCLLESIPDKLRIQGEISNLKLSNGNMFMTLKDQDQSQDNNTSAISVVSWGYAKYHNINTDNLGNGDKITIEGKLACYSKNGTYSIQINKLENDGIGDMQLLYEKQKKYFEKKGYFDNKKPMPDTLNNIGIITSPEGAAIQDILFVLKKNKFVGNIFIKRCNVQGNMCPSSVIESLEYLNNYDTKLDLILLTRGGGSYEDLMGYSDPKVIKAIHKSKIFTMSAIGHEIDFMLSDYVADLRAPTPSIGAEIISKTQIIKNSRLKELEEFVINIKSQIIAKINNQLNKLDYLELSNKNYNAKIKTNLENTMSKLNNLEQILNYSINHSIKKHIHNQEKIVCDLENKLEKYNFKKIQDYGFSQVFIKIKNKYILCDSLKEFKKIYDADNKIKIRINFKDGNINI